MVLHEGVRGLAPPDFVLDAFWWRSAGLVAPFPDVIDTLCACTTSGVGLVAQFDVDSEL